MTRRGRPVAAWLLASSLGASLAVGLAAAWPATTLVSPAELVSPAVHGRASDPPPTPAPGQFESSTARDGPSSAATLQVHVLAPRSVPIGGTRQLRVQVADDRPGSTADGSDQLHVHVQSDDQRISVRPGRVVVPRTELASTRFALAARPDLTCDDRLSGGLTVTVVPLDDPDRAGVRQIELPELDCRDAPPAAPDSVHVTDAICGEDLDEQLERLLDGEDLDPRRCAPDRWQDGELQPWPPPEPTPPAAPEPPAAAPSEEPEPEQPPDEPGPSDDDSDATGSDDTDGDENETDETDETDDAQPSESNDDQEQPEDVDPPTEPDDGGTDGDSGDDDDASEPPGSGDDESDADEDGDGGGGGHEDGDEDP